MKDECICSSCKTAAPLSVMYKISTGRRVQWLCPKCYSKAMNDTAKRIWRKKIERERKC